MPKEIYNEGRVVGLSAWEIFCRNVLENNPDATVPSEHAWLASSIGSGATVIMKIPKGSSGVQEFALPASSTLSAAGVIVASPFNGECSWAGVWAQKVISYGGLIPNTSDKHPTSTEIPYNDEAIDDIATQRSLAEYMKLQDGVVYHVGDWIDTETTPEKDLIYPDFKNANCTIRIYISSPLKYDVKLMLTGFTDKWVLSGISSMDNGSTNTTYNEWRNGGMVGPSIFPWASKIIFTVPTVSYQVSTSYQRNLPGDLEINKTKIGSYPLSGVNARVDGAAVIDMESADPLVYYTVNATQYSNAVLVQDSKNITPGLYNQFNTLATWYPGMSANRINSLADTIENNKYFFAPAIYGIKVSADGKRNLVPLDVAAPGTIKVFNNADTAYAYTQQVPDNFAIYHDTINNGNYFVDHNNSDINTWQAMNSKVEVKDEDILTGNVSTTASVLYTTAGSKTVRSISLDDSNGNALALDSTGKTGEDRFVTVPKNQRGVHWSQLLAALNDGKDVDLGSEFHILRGNLPNLYVGENKILIGRNGNQFIQSKLASDNSEEIVFSVAPKSGKNYITFNNGLRLYISNTDPGTAGVPNGSIGIGW